MSAVVASVAAQGPAPPDGSGQLAPLKELPLPDAVSYVPQTVGWIVLAVLLVAAFAVAGWLVWRRRRRQLYRRVALAELAGIEASLIAARADAAQRASALAAIARLLKRTSLAVAPRDQVASLSGDAWLAFLQRTRGRFDARSGALLALTSYAPAQQVAAISAEDTTALIAHARDWIEHHHVEV